MENQGKAVIIRCDNTAEVTPISSKDSEFNATVTEIIGNWYECVSPCKFTELFPKTHYVMLVDEEGVLKPEYKINPLASFYYGTDTHGALIANDVVVVKVAETDKGMDLLPLSDDEATIICKDAVQRNAHLPKDAIIYKKGEDFIVRQKGGQDNV